MESERVTLKDVYDVVTSLEEKMDRRFADHEARIRRNESVRIQIIAIAGVVSMAISFFAAEIKNIFGR